MFCDEKGFSSGERRRGEERGKRIKYGAAPAIEVEGIFSRHDRPNPTGGNNNNNNRPGAAGWWTVDGGLWKANGMANGRLSATREKEKKYSGQREA